MINRVHLAALAATIACGSFALPARAQEPSAATPTAKPVAKATVTTPSTSSRTTKAVPQARPLVVTVDLISGTKITGTLTDQTSLEMRTSFGPASLPLSEVAGIRFATADEPTTTSVLHNGDSLTGATDVKIVTVETEWGTATINGQSVKSILFVPDVVWNPDTSLGGKRWSLVSSKKPVAPKPQATAQQQNRVPTQNSSSYPSRSRTVYRGR